MLRANRTQPGPGVESISFGAGHVSRRCARAAAAAWDWRSGGAEVRCGVADFGGDPPVACPVRSTSGTEGLAPACGFRGAEFAPAAFTSAVIVSAERTPIES